MGCHYRISNRLSRALSIRQFRTGINRPLQVPSDANKQLKMQHVRKLVDDKAVMETSAPSALDVHVTGAAALRKNIP